MKNVFLFLEKYFAYLFVRFCGLSWQIKTVNRPKNQKVIYIFWHQNMLPLLYLHRGENIAILASASKDGELIAGPAKLFGYKTARGSSGRHGISATKKLVKLSKENSLAITPDGPKGPAQILKIGALFVAYSTQLSIVPVCVKISKKTIFKTWDKFQLPHLFSKIKIEYGEPIFIKSKDEFTIQKNKIEKILNS